MLSRIQRVAVLGGGPSGAVAAKCLLAEGLQPTIFEQRSTFGGVWNYTPETKERLPQVPLEDPNIEDEPMPDVPSRTSGASAPIILSPIYASLETNIPKDLMIFKNLPLNDSLQLFPKHQDINHYVQEYSKELKHITKFNTRIVHVAKGNDQRWDVKSQSIISQGLEHDSFDAVVIATGHYIVPYIPPIPGIAEFESRYPGSIQHSKYFRTSENYRAKKVVVVGNSASGIDIALQIADVAQEPLIQSCKSTDGFRAFPSINDSNIKIVPPISEFNPETRSLFFQDGQETKDIDMVLFCTGYLHSLPFLEDSKNSKERIITDGFYMHHLYQHLFYIPDPTLSIVGLPTKVIPFPISECQAAVIAGVYSGRLSLPSKDEMTMWEQNHLLRKGADRHFHFLNFPEDADYMDMMNDWNRQTLDFSRNLYEPTQWGPKEREIRKAIPKLKAAFINAKKDGRLVRTKEELGFPFS